MVCVHHDLHHNVQVRRQFHFPIPYYMSPNVGIWEEKNDTQVTILYIWCLHPKRSSDGVVDTGVLSLWIESSNEPSVKCAVLSLFSAIGAIKLN